MDSRADGDPRADRPTPSAPGDDGALVALPRDGAEGHWDVIVVGSGFGGSVSALRLAEKGYSVLVIEKGRRFAPADFPRTNWNLKRWMWNPALNWRGLFKMTFFRHVTILSGVGVGGGSLVYANTLPVPKSEFFQSPSWAHLADWEQELAPHYETARRMLGATKNPRPTLGDRILREIARDLGREEHFDSNEVSVFFGESGQTVPDPYFGGEGPERTGCVFCGGCMTGCRHGAKNTLDKNYLYLAERKGAQVLADTEVTAIRSRSGGGYRVEARTSLGWIRRRPRTFTADRVILAGGVLGTVDLLLRMRDDPNGLPKLSPRLGQGVRTNSEALIGVTSPNRKLDFSEGIAITSILHTDPYSHVEPVRYGSGSGFFRTLLAPHAPGPNVFIRLVSAARGFFRTPWRWMRAYFVRNWARQTQILLYMRTLDGSLAFVRRRSPLAFFRRKMVTRASDGEVPTSFIPEATDIAERFASKVEGVTANLFSETLMGIPTTAHILGGCCMGKDASEGVIDRDHRVFGYDGLYVIDGSAISSNPGVNPSLTITALAERAMAQIAARRDKAEQPAHKAAQPVASPALALGVTTLLLAVLICLALLLVAWSPAAPMRVAQSGEGTESTAPAHGHHGHHGAMVHDFSDAPRWAAEWDNPERDAWQMPDEVVRLMEIEPGMAVVDLGAGTGYFLPHLAAAVGPEGSVVGLDIEPNMVEYMNQRVAREGLAQASARLVTPEDPQLAPGSVDRILVVDTWHHVEGREAYAARLAQALRPGGRVIIVDFTAESPHGPPVEYRLTPEAVSEELRAGGLEPRVLDEPLPHQYIVSAALP